MPEKKASKKEPKGVGEHTRHRRLEISSRTGVHKDLQGSPTQQMCRLGYAWERTTTMSTQREGEDTMEEEVGSERGEQKEKEMMEFFDGRLCIERYLSTHCSHIPLATEIHSCIYYLQKYILRVNKCELHFPSNKNQRRYVGRMWRQQRKKIGKKLILFWTFQYCLLACLPCRR